MTSWKRCVPDWCAGHLDSPLDRRLLPAATGSWACHRIEHVDRRAARDDAIGHGVGVPLVGVALLAHAALELHSTTLLDDVSRLVRGGVEIGRALERYRVACRVGFCSDRLRGLGGRAPGMGRHAGN